MIFPSHRISILAADDLVMPGARASAGIVLTMSLQNFPVPALQEL